MDQNIKEKDLKKYIIKISFQELAILFYAEIEKISIEKFKN